MISAGQNPTLDTSVERRTDNLSFLTVMSGYLIVCVVAIHTLDLYWRSYNNGGLFINLNFPHKLVELIIRYAVPIFVFISAFKFQLSYERKMKTGKPFLMGEYVRSRIERLIISYLVWSAFYLVLRIVRDFIQTRAFIWPSPQELNGILIGYGNFAYQLWFIPMLFVVSIGVIFLKFVVKRPEILYVVYIIHILLTVVFPNTINYFPLSNWLSYFLSFEIGLYCARAYLKQARLPNFLIITLFWLGLCLLKLVNQNLQVDAFLDLMLFIVAPTFVYQVAINFFSQVSEKNILYQIGLYTWPIFLIHAPFLTSLTTSALDRFHVYSLLTALPITLGITLVSIVIYKIIERFSPKRLMGVLF